MQDSNNLHLARKFWHVGMGCFLFWALFYSDVTRPTLIIALASCLAITLLSEIGRLYSKQMNALFLKFFGPLMRDYETKSLTGTPFYLTGTLISFSFFSPVIAQIALLNLIFADPVASIAGILSKHKGPKLCEGKTLIGTGGAVLVCLLIGLAYAFRLQLDMRSAFILVATNGLAGAVVELFPLKINDNLLFPVISALILWPVLTFVLP